ncbi:MAG: hypothetical protein KKB50_11245 [Planctomycetes bacterium]|nr:hypothetical protein [Planctomycetota bacterium]
MNVLNSVLTPLAGLLLAPFAWAPLLALVFWSAVLGVLMALGFRHTSNQAALKVNVDRIRAYMLAMKLFKDDLAVTLRCQGALFKHIGLRLAHSLPPMLVMLVPLVLILTQLALRYEKRPLQVGEEAVVTLQLSPAAWAEHNGVALEVPAGMVVTAGRVRDAQDQTVSWRVRPDVTGALSLRWHLGDQVAEKELAVAEDAQRLTRVAARRPGPGFWDRLLYPGEAGFAVNSPVQSIEVRYPQRSTRVFGFDVPWWATFFILSMVCALLARPFLKVQF